MRTLERISLYVLVTLVSLSLLDRVRADDDAGSKGSVTVEVTKLEIKDAEGKVVLRLAAAAHGGGEITVMSKEGRVAARLFARSDADGELMLYDETGQLRTGIGANDEGGYANFYNRKGDMACYVGGDAGKERGYVALYGAEKTKTMELVGTDRGGVVKIADAAGKKQLVHLGAAADNGAGSLALAAPGGAKAAELSATAKGGALALLNAETSRTVALLAAAPDTGTGVLALAEPKGKEGITLYTSQHGGQINVLNASGNKAAFLGVSANPAGNGLCYVARDDGQRLWEVGRNSLRGGYMSIRNGQGKRVVFLGATTGDQADDGVLEVSQRSGKLGVVLRGYGPQSSVRVYDAAGKVKSMLR